MPTQWRARPPSWRELARARPTRTSRLTAFLEASGLELEDVYQGHRHLVGPPRRGRPTPRAAGPAEQKLRRACGRLLHLDDGPRIEAYRRFLRAPTAPRASALNTAERRLLRMLVASLLDQAAHKQDDLDAGARLVWEHPQVRTELLELLDVLEPRVAHVTHPLDSLPDVPLRVHARYTRLEILAAFGIDGDRARVAPWQSGVYWAKDSSADLFAFTLDKTDGHFSPTTRYRDYAISRDLIHWESQSATRADSPTGERYRHHAARGTHVILFARHRQSDRAFYLLGPATYVSHRSERPMAITWRLQHPLPGDLFASFAAAVA